MHTPRTRSSLYSPRNSEPILRELTRARLPAKSPPYRTLRMLAHGHGSGVVGFQVDRGIGTYSLLQSCIGLRSDPFGVVLTGARRKYGGQLEPGSRPTPMRADAWWWPGKERSTTAGASHTPASFPSSAARAPPAAPRATNSQRRSNSNYAPRAGEPKSVVDVPPASVPLQPRATSTRIPDAHSPPIAT